MLLAMVPEIWEVKWKEFSSHYTPVAGCAARLPCWKGLATQRVSEHKALTYDVGPVCIINKKRPGKVLGSTARENKIYINADIDMRHGRDVVAQKQ